MSGATTAQADQVRAALDHSEAVIRSVAARNGTPVHEGARIPWLVDQVADLLRAVRDGTARTCRHVGIGQSPRPMMAAAWDPGRLTCFPCTDRLPPLSAEADATCDRCGRVVQPIHPGAMRVGLILLTWGLCRRCCRETGVPLHPKDVARGGR